MMEIQGCFKGIAFVSGLALSLFLNLSPALAKDQSAPDYLEFIGTCDASAAVPLDESGDGRKFIVAGDENSILNIYDWNAASEGDRIDLVGIIPGLTDEVELDLEGAAKLGETTYWIGSHSRTKDGKLALERHIFFALQFKQENGKTRATLKGSPCNNILKNLVEDPGYKALDFEDFSRADDRALAGESTRGFNIEALSAWQGKHLLLGLRGPLRQGQAILIPLLNPAEVIAKKKPVFGEMITLDLDGYGVRGMEYIPALKTYAILGGSVGDSHDCQLYLWSGRREDTKPKRVKNFVLRDKFNPESVFYFEDSGSIFILSDDGNQRYHGIKCKDLEEKGVTVFFRGFSVEKP